MTHNPANAILSQRRDETPAPSQETPTSSLDGNLPPEIAAELLATWPGLPAEQRTLWFKVLDALLPPDADLLEQLEQLEDARYLDALSAEDRQAIPMAQAVAELGYTPP